MDFSVALHSSQFFEAGALLMRIPAPGRLLSGAVLTSVSIFSTMNASNCETVIAATLLVGVTYGLVTPAGRERILEIIDPRFQTTAIGLMDGCYSFFGGTVAMLYAGSLAEAFWPARQMLPDLLLVFYGWAPFGPCLSSSRRLQGETPRKHL